MNLLNHEVEWRASQKLLDYEPLPKQDPFHKSGASCRALFGGNRSGKTTAGGIEFLFHITGQYPDWYPKTQRYLGAIKGRIIVKDFTKAVGEVINPFFREWLDYKLIEKIWKNPQGVPIKYQFKNGSVFDILTHEQSTESFEGWKGHIAWFDEPPPRDKYIATLRGLVDFQGRHWLTLTPLTQPWIYDFIYTKKSENIFCVTMDMRDNTYLTEEAIKEMEEAMTEDEKEARLHGRFMHLSGLVYKEFFPGHHVVERPVIQKHWTRYMAVDPHPRTPTAVLWLAVDEQDNHWVYDELWLKDMDIKAIAYAILAQEGDFPSHVKLIDPHADADNVAAGGFNFRKELMKYGVYTQRANSDPMLGKSKIRQVLTLRYNPMIKREIPQLHIGNNCTQTIYEFQHYIWEDHKRNKEEYALKEKPKKKDDHLMDCLRYIYNYGPRYIQQEEDEFETKYEGKYTKYPVAQQQSGGKTGYHDLVEGEMGSGQGGNF